MGSYYILKYINISPLLLNLLLWTSNPQRINTCFLLFFKQGTHQPQWPWFLEILPGKLVCACLPSRTLITSHVKPVILLFIRYLIKWMDIGLETKCIFNDATGDNGDILAIHFIVGTI